MGSVLKTAKVKEGKASHYTGKWNDNGCEMSRNVTNEGEYEWYPGLTGIGQHGVSKEDFESKSTSPKAVLSSALGTVACKKTTDVATVLGAQYNVEEIRFKGCTLSVTKGKCTGVGIPELAEGEIPVFADTYLIDHGTLGSSGLEPKEGEVWNAFFASEGGPYYPYMAVFVCAPGILFRVGGQVSAVVTPVSVMRSGRTMTLGEGIGEQDLVGEYSSNGGVTWNPTGPSLLTLTAKSSTKDDSKIEVRDCNEIGAVSEGKGAQPCEVEEPLPW